MSKNIKTLIEQARSDLSKLTGLNPSSIIGAVKSENGWRISIEMIEKKSIPDQMDILATYEVVIDEDGNLLNFERKSLRKRIDTGT